MSAFLCNDLQFEAVVVSYYQHMGKAPLLTQFQLHANTLKRENIRSVNWRYGERKRFKPVVFIGFDQTPSIEQVIQWLRCIEYQSCERDDYEKSEACRLNMRMQNDLLYKLVGDRRFDSTKWSI